MRSCLCTFLGDPLSCKFLHATFHITRQCIGPVQLDDGVVDDLEEILWDQAALSVLTRPTWGVPNASEHGTQSEVAHKWAGWLHNPCRLGGP